MEIRGTEQCYERVKKRFLIHETNKIIAKGVAILLMKGSIIKQFQTNPEFL